MKKKPIVKVALGANGKLLRGAWAPAVGRAGS